MEKDTLRVIWYRKVIFPLLPVLFTSLIVHGAETARNARARVPRKDAAQLAVGRSDVIRTFKGKQVLCEKYLVEKGDSVWQILHQRINGSVSQIIHWSKVLHEFNPEIVDPNVIYPGQSLLVPLGFLSQAEADTQIGPRERRTKIYVVMPGDTLSGILRYRFHFPVHLVFNEAINEVKSLNPQIKDFKRIRPGQHLIIPLSMATTSAELNRSAAAEEVTATTIDQSKSMAPLATEQPNGKQGFERSPSSAELITSVRISNEKRASSAVQEESTKSFPMTRILSHLEPNEKRIQVLAEAITATVTALGGQCFNKGVYSLPLKGQGEIILNSNRFPMLKLPTGESIFLDLNDRLPDNLEKAVQAIWDGRYHFINVRETDNFRSILQRVIEKTTMMEIRAVNDPLFIHEPLNVSIRGDWILTYSKPPLLERKIIVVNLLKNEQERTDPALQTYLDGLGIKVVDVQLRGQLEPARIFVPVVEKAFKNTGKPVVPRSRSAPDAVEAFLKLLGQEHNRDASVRLDSEDHRGIRVTVKAGFYFQRNGNFHLIDFHQLSPPIINLLREWRLRVLVVDPGFSSAQVFKAMMDHMNFDTNSSYSFFVSSREPKRNIHLGFPGDLIKDVSGSYFLTPMSSPPSLTEFLHRNGVRVLSYQTSQSKDSM